MSEPGKAVFLSYASQDAEPARRICEALRAAGVEVWFDLNELRGGDAWDAKIRRHIRECALFVPLITPNTDARPEGYFRLEWKLAVDRSHLVADDHPFLFPIVLGDVHEATARVPDRFREVQWTRLRLDETPSELSARVARILTGNRIEPGPGRPSTSSAPAGHTPPKRWQWWMIFPIGGMLMGLMFAALPLWKSFNRSSSRAEKSATVPVPPAPGATASPAKSVRVWPHNPELKRAVALLDGYDAIPEDFKLAEDIVTNVLANNPVDPEAVVALARVHSMWLLRGWDLSEPSFLKAKSTAERAVLLAPDEAEAYGALGIYLYLRRGEETRALEVIKRAIALDPDQPRFYRTRNNLLFVIKGVTPAEALEESKRTVARFPKDALVRYELGRHYRNMGQMADFERENEAAIALAPISNALSWRARAQFSLHGNLPAMKAALDQTPQRARTGERNVLGYFLYSAMSGDSNPGLEMLQAMPDSWIIDFNYEGPKALFVAALLAQQGKPSLARLQYEAALAEVQKRKALQPTNTSLFHVEACILLGLGRVDEARAAARVILEEIERPYRMPPLTTWWFEQIPLRLLLGERETALQLLRETAGDATVRSVIRRLMLLDPRMAPFRDDPEIKALLADPETKA